jgi:hypothetical protein
MEVHLPSAIQPVAMIPHLTVYGVEDAMSAVVGWLDVSVSVMMTGLERGDNKILKVSSQRLGAWLLNPRATGCCRP